MTQASFSFGRLGLRRVERRVFAVVERDAIFRDVPEKVAAMRKAVDGRPNVRKVLDFSIRATQPALECTASFDGRNSGRERPVFWRCEPQALVAEQRRDCSNCL